MFGCKDFFCIWLILYSPILCVPCMPQWGRETCPDSCKHLPSHECSKTKTFSSVRLLFCFVCSNISFLYREGPSKRFMSLMRFSSVDHMKMYDRLTLWCRPFVPFKGSIFEFWNVFCLNSLNTDKEKEGQVSESILIKKEVHFTLPPFYIKHLN